MTDIKVDLFKFLDRLNNSDIDFFEHLTAENKKSFAPIVILRWLSGTTDKKSINYLNHLVNSLIFNLYKHPDLLFKLMMASSSGGSKKFKWLKNNKQKKQSISIDILKKYYSCNTYEANQYLQIH